jgi:hypothetical protein
MSEPCTHRYSRFPQTIGAGDMPYEEGSYDYRGKAKKIGKASKQ